MLPQDDGLSRHEGFRILIVEDSPAFRRVLREILSREFPAMSIEEVGDGTEAMEKIKTFLPNLVFMDIRLPGVNGLELTAMIRKDYPEVTVIVLTSYDLEEYREAAQRYGANYFLAKGTTTEEEIVSLVKRVESGLTPPLEGARP